MPAEVDDSNSLIISKLKTEFHWGIWRSAERDEISHENGLIFRLYGGKYGVFSEAEIENLKAGCKGTLAARRTLDSMGRTP